MKSFKEYAAFKENVPDMAQIMNRPLKSPQELMANQKPEPAVENSLERRLKAVLAIVERNKEQLDQLEKSQNGSLYWLLKNTIAGGRDNFI
jgi:hypothetical protein